MFLRVYTYSTCVCVCFCLSPWFLYQFFFYYSFSFFFLFSTIFWRPWVFTAFCFIACLPRCMYAWDWLGVCAFLSFVLFLHLKKILSLSLITLWVRYFLSFSNFFPRKHKPTISYIFLLIHAFTFFLFFLFSSMLLVNSTSSSFGLSVCLSNLVCFFP